MRIDPFGGSVVIKRGVSRYDFRDPYHVAIDLSWREFGLLFIGAEIAINLVFAFLYMIRPGCIANARPGVFSDAFFFSIETLATVGYVSWRLRPFTAMLFPPWRSSPAWPSRRS
jgi:inward rectifier potassium channel